MIPAEWLAAYFVLSLVAVYLNGHYGYGVGYRDGLDAAHRVPEPKPRPPVARCRLRLVDGRRPYDWAAEEREPVA